MSDAKSTRAAWDDVLDSVIENYRSRAAIESIVETGHVLAAVAMAVAKPRYRKRRGRAVSVAAKRRHVRRQRALWASAVAHNQARIAWLAVLSKVESQMVQA